MHIGAGFCPNPDREKGANHATSMTTLTQIWMTLLLSNILPSDHNSDLPLLKCQLVYVILTQMSVHVA